MSYADDAFANLKTTLEITQTETGLAVKRHHRIRDYVRRRGTLKMIS
jgi:hypothetical protein